MSLQHDVSSSPQRPTVLRLPRLRLTLAHLWRCTLVALMTLTFVISSYSTLTPHAHAAQHAFVKPQPPAHHKVTPPSHPYLAPLTSHKALTVSPNVSSSMPFDGVGQLPFYTYITHPITSPTCTCGKKELLVNVANGNLIMHSVEMQIHGTAGLDLDIEAYYNSLASYSRDLGQNWVLSLGHDVRLDLSNPSVGITYHGPSGYSAYFAYNSSTSTYADAPGLNATLTKNADGTYTLSFHQTGAKFIFASGSHLIAVKDKNGNTISLSLDGDNDVNTITDTHSRVISFTHNMAFGTGHSPEGQVTKFSDPTGRTASYSYTNNQLMSETDLNGKTTSYQYNGSDLVQITDPMNNVTKIAYNSNHQVTSITEPTVGTSTGVTTFTYNTGSTVVTDQRQHNTTYNYDPMGKVMSIVNDSGKTVDTMTYNSNYNMLVLTDALTNKTTASYDGNNNLTSEADDNGVKSMATYTNTTFPYYPSSATDAQGNTTSMSYDPNGNMNGTTNTSITPHVSTSQMYNGNGTVQSSTDANGYKTTYGYTNGDLTSVTPPSPQHGQTLGYDTLSRLTSVIDGNGNQTSYTYTNLDRIKTISYKDSSNNNASSITYTYDDDGNVLSVVDSSAGTTSFTYDALNRQTKKTLPDTSTITYTYDATSDLTSLTDIGGTVNYSYNNLNQMTVIDEPDAAYAGGRDSIDYTYYDNGQVYDINYGSLDRQYGYDKGGRITFTQMAGEYSTLDSYSYTYTIGTAYTSLRASVSSTLGSASWVTNYSYDQLNRLTGATTTGAYPMTSSYSYDANGNRLSGSTTGTGASTPYNNSYVYDTANQLKQVNSTTCTNDGNGNQTGCGTSYTETYNPRNQTTSASSPNGNLTHQYVGADSTERVSTGGYHATTYTYNALGLGTEKDSLGDIIAYTRDNKGNLVSERTSSDSYHYLFDGLGSVVGLMDGNENLVNTYVYDPYGVTEHQTGSQYNPWQFASGYFDSYTLYYKYGTRYYDRFGRWTQKDSQPSANPYVYANDDPVNVVDPSGNDAIDCILAFIIIAGLAITVVSLLGLALFADPPLTVALAFFAYLGVAGAAIAFAAGVIITLRSRVCS